MGVARRPHSQSKEVVQTKRGADLAALRQIHPYCRARLRPVRHRIRRILVGAVAIAKMHVSLVFYGNVLPRKTARQHFLIVPFVALSAQRPIEEDYVHVVQGRWGVAAMERIPHCVANEACPNPAVLKVKFGDRVQELGALRILKNNLQHFGGVIHDSRNLRLPPLAVENGLADAGVAIHSA